MKLLGLIYILICPFILGNGVSIIIRERLWSRVEKYAVGFLSLFLLAFPVLLVSLKLKFSLNQFEKAYFAVFFLMLLICCIVICLEAIRTKKGVAVYFDFNKQECIRTVTLIVSGIALILVTGLSFTNDNTFEIVKTTVSTGTIYQYSAFTGKLMENGLPIFNKILVAPMIYSLLSDSFGMSERLVMSLLIPATVISLSLCLINEVLKIINKKQMAKVFFPLLFLLMICETYLPSNGIATTLGFALLLEGYSGYAIFYGIVLPFVVLSIHKRKYGCALISLITLPMFIRIDRLFFALSNPYKSFSIINTSGKFMALFLVALILLLVKRLKRDSNRNAELIILPSVFVIKSILDLSEYVEAKKRKWLIVGAAFAILSICNFRIPAFNNPNYYLSLKNEEQIARVLDSITDADPDSVIWSVEAVMDNARRLNGNVKLLYGRASFEPTLQGLDYETASEYTMDYKYYMLNKEYGFDYLLTSVPTTEVVSLAVQDGANTIIMPETVLSESYISDFENAGFHEDNAIGNYKIYKIGN